VPIARLLKEGFDINSKDDPETALYGASRYAQKAVIKLLLESGADIKVEDFGAVFLVASANGHRAVAEFLLKTGADFNAKKW
jgi:ankyrin repeat protein